MTGGFSFSTAEGLAQLRGQARLDQWVAVHESFFWSMDFVEPENGRFAGAVDATVVGPVGIATLAASFVSGRRDHNHIARDSRDNFTLSINMGETPMHTAHAGHENSIEPGAAVLLTGTEPFTFASPSNKNCLNLAVPQFVLAASVRHAETRLGLRIDAQQEALQLLRRYCRLLHSEDPLKSPSLQTHAANTIVDLLNLATSAVGEAADLGRLRGLRAGRLASVLERIRVGYAQPGISAESVGRELGLSARYVQDLLAETGIGFAERVLELRLQMTRGLLTNRTSDSLRISEIAYAGGFSDISYFNRCFRRRFGCTPGSLR